MLFRCNTDSTSVVPVRYPVVQTSFKLTKYRRNYMHYVDSGGKKKNRLFHVTHAGLKSTLLVLFFLFFLRQPNGDLHLS